VTTTIETNAILPRPEGDWHPWAHGNWFPPECGSHSYQMHEAQTKDFTVKAEKGWQATGKFHVVHRYHQPKEACGDECRVYGDFVREEVEDVEPGTEFVP
jgi:hypothetical protein